MKFFAAFAGTMLCTVPVSAAERGYTLTGFDRISVEGPYSVIVETGKGGSARAIGTPQAIDRVSVEVRSRTLIIRNNKSAWGGWPGSNHGPVTLRVTTPQLINAGLSGSGNLTVSKMRASRLSVFLSGSGALTVNSLEADQLFMTLQGSGQLNVTGSALLSTTATNGSGSLIADNLLVGDLKMSSQSSGNAKIAVRRSADIASTGSGTVTIIGAPACTVNALGSGDVICGK